MAKFSAFILSAFLLSLLSGCVSLVDATTSGPIKTDPGRRSFGNKIDDSNLRTIVAVNLKKASEELDQAHINIYCFNQTVLMTGQVETKQAYTLAGETARNVSRVRQVYNELQIQPKTSFISRTNDGYLEIKIATKLLAHNDIDSSRVELVVEDAIVYLMGIMTQVQADKITDVVANTSGVKKVVRAIEYIE
ncbi:BON domain-containing protein [Teredinibacter purpureus]|uniref:BON domain-containing protein n=1 Tax=Teredinibacter purpureus TaxID=2731756 RepID=UPI0005F839F0|nr:BON domain-containing protein [Teredinibacter purpureus]